MPETEPAILIIGQGLAGTALAWQLWSRHLPFLIVDPDDSVTSSKIAAGLIAPITGMRLSLHENYLPWLIEAVRFYREKERLLHQHFLHARGHVHLYKDDTGPERWAKRKLESSVQAFLYRNAMGIDKDVFNTGRGGFQTKHAGWLDTASYLEASRRFFEAMGSWQHGTVAHDELIESTHRIEWYGRRFSHAVFCTGWKASRIPWFDWVPFEPARGTIFSARADLRGEKRIINSGCWIVPRDDGTARIGSTYETKFADPHGTDPHAITELHAKIQRLIKVPVQIESQVSAVRPVIRLQRTLIGIHPAHPRIGFFNGLGSKGTLRAPIFARTLVNHLIDDTPVPTEVDLRANL